METEHIALPLDWDSIPGLQVTAGSIAHHASRDVMLMKHVLYGSILDDTFEDMAAIVKSLHSVEASRHAASCPERNEGKQTVSSHTLPILSHTLFLPPQQ